MRWWVGLALAVLLGGCALLTSTPQNRAQARAFINGVADAYRVPRPRIVMGGVVEGGALYKDGTVFIHAAVLGDRYRDELLAHEMAHYVLGHQPTTLVAGIATPQAWATQHAKEIAAHVKAVEILRVSRHVTELQALAAMHGYLVNLGDRQANRPATTASFGRRTGCGEAGELLAMFPQHRAVTVAWRCQPA